MALPTVHISRGAQRRMVAQFALAYSDTMVPSSAPSDSTNQYTAPVAVNTAGTQTFNIIGVPPGAIILGGALIVDTAFNTTGTATLALGDAVLATRYLAATSIKATGLTALTQTGYIDTPGNALLATIALADAAATTGALRVQLEYITNGRVDEVERSLATKIS